MNMQPPLLGFMLCLAVSQATSVFSYELRTHGEVTRQAYQNSQFITAYLSRLGLRETDRFDLESRTQPRYLGLFENSGTAVDWMIEGTIREDDFAPSRIGAAAGCIQPNNPPSEINRVYNHFLDVQRNGSGVTVRGLEVGIPATDWALGRRERGQGSKQNQFSLLDARDYQYQSLTASSRGEREKYTALMFRALGQVLHLVQDMAQPQHTRNDPHPDCSDGVSWLIGGHSWYEQYVEDRTLGRPFLKAGAPASLVLAGYAAVQTRPYQDFFSEAGQRGLADFSSRNFFSVGTNLGRFLDPCGGLLAPPCEPGVYKRETTSDPINTLKGTLTVPITFYLRDVVDNLTGIPIRDVRVTSRSLWDEHLEKVNKSQKFTLNRFNYDAMADILLPRAVGYAAGFLDTFFRGQASAWVDESTFAIVAGTEAMEGTFELLHERDNGPRHRLASWTLRIDPEGASPPLQVPRLAPEEGPGSLCWLVFRGRLGDELDAITVAPNACPMQGPPPPQPPAAHWVLYFCGDFFHPVLYRYALYWTDFPEDAPSRIYVTNSSRQVTCSRQGFYPEDEQPPGTVTEHPV